MIAAIVTDNILVTATHGLILLSTIGGIISSLLINRRKINKIDEKVDRIEVSINGGLTDKIRAALKERDAP